MRVAERAQHRDSFSQNPPRSSSTQKEDPRFRADRHTDQPQRNFQRPSCPAMSSAMHASFRNAASTSALRRAAEMAAHLVEPPSLQVSLRSEPNCSLKAYCSVRSLQRVARTILATVRRHSPQSSINSIAALKQGSPTGPRRRRSNLARTGKCNQEASREL